MIGSKAIAVALTVAAVVATPPLRAQSSETADAAKVQVALEILTKMHVIEQQSRSLKSVAPLFAAQVLAMPAAQMPSVLTKAVATSDGKARVQALLTDEYIKSFTAHLPDLKAAIAAVYARRMTLDELKALNVFLDTPAGKSWADVSLDGMSAGALAGREIGRQAGIEAANAVMAQLDAAGSDK